MDVTVTATSQEDTSKSGSASFSITVTAVTVNIIDLPAGSAGAVTLTGPDGHTILVTASETLLALTGTYTAVIAPVIANAATYETPTSLQTAVVSTGSTSVITVDYYDVVPLTTKVLDSAGIQSLQVSSDGITLTIDSSSVVGQSLQSGDVLIVPPTTVDGGAPKGLLRRILTVNAGTSVITMTVQDATLADAFQRLRLQFSSQVTPQTGQLVRTAEGVRFLPPETHRTRHTARTALAQAALPDPCGTTSLGLVDIAEPINFAPAQGLILSGQVELCSGINFSVDLVGKGFLDLQPQLNSLTATATMGEYSDLSLSGEFLQGAFDLEPVTIATIPVPPILVPGLPVWVTPEITVFVGAQGSVSSGFSTEVSAAVTTTAGVTYSAGQWNPVQPTPSFQFTFAPPSLDVSLNAKAYVGLKLDLFVYDVVGPSFKPDGYLQFSADITQNPWWTLTGGLEGPMSLDVGFLGETVASYDLGNMFDYSWLIAKAPGPLLPTDSNASLQSISPEQGPAGGPGFILNLIGSNFIPGANVNFGSTSLETAWQNSGALTANVPATLLSVAGVFPMTVSNPGGTSSNAVSFTVTSLATGAVTITPQTATVPEGGLQLFSATVSGGGGVTWNVEEGPQGGTITSAGTYTAPGVTGTFHVVATNAANSSQNATAVVTIISTATPGTITTVAGGGFGCTQETDAAGDGCPNNLADLVRPSGVATDQAGNIYIADTDNSRIRVVNTQSAPITIAGVTIQPNTVATVAGNGTEGYTGDGGPASSAEINSPEHLTLDPSGNIFISDSYNHVVRLVNTQAHLITYAGVSIQPGNIATVAGGGANCASAADDVGDGCPATQAQLNFPDGIGLGPASTLYIADYYGERVRGVSALTGVITSVAGTGFGGYSGDGGPAADAQLYGPSRTSSDTKGNLFIADIYNSRVRIVDAATNLISTVAGNGTYGSLGDGGPATSAELSPISVVTDKAGNIYVADFSNQRIRVVNLQTTAITVLGVMVQPGAIETVVGNGSTGYSGDGGLATNATIDGPTGLWFDSSGNLYFADSINGVIRKVTGP